MRLSEIQKPSPEEREMFLIDIYQSIQQCDQYLDQLEARYEKLGCRLISPSYFNFRDALFHYEKAYNSQETIQLHCERHAMLEHLHRALKDGCIKYLQLLNERLDLLYNYPDSPERRKQLDQFTDVILTKTSLTKKQLLAFDLDISKLDKALEKNTGTLGDDEFRILCEALLAFNLYAVPGRRKKLQQVIHASRNLDVRTRNDSMHIRKPFGIESGLPTEPAPIDSFLFQCDQMVCQLEQDGLFPFVIAAKILKDKRRLGS